ncbi:hypothetical protein D0O09_08310 [Pseudomonas putida]|nr:hypothetical protein D0O09_08310 [Pseudomonas putida]
MAFVQREGAVDDLGWGGHHCLFLAGLQQWLLRGHARSHKDRTQLKDCAVPVGAGAPAKRPVQVTAEPPSPTCRHSACATRPGSGHGSSRPRQSRS